MQKRIVSILFLLVVADVIVANPAVERQRHVDRMSEYRKYINGQATVRGQGVFRSALRKFGHRSDIQAELQRPVNPLPANNFAPRSSVFRYLRCDGTLEPTEVDRRATLQQEPEFVFLWYEIVSSLRGSGVIRRVDLDRLHASFARFRSHATTAQAKYVKCVGRLFDEISKPDGNAILRKYIDMKGCQFQGGDVGALAQHVLDCDVVVVNGSQAHRELSGLARVLERHLITNYHQARSARSQAVSTRRTAARQWNARQAIVRQARSRQRWRASPALLRPQDRFGVQDATISSVNFVR